MVSTELAANKSCFLLWLQLLAQRELFCFFSIMKSCFGDCLVFIQLPNLPQTIFSSQYLLLHKAEWHVCLPASVWELSSCSENLQLHITHADIKRITSKVPPPPHTHTIQRFIPPSWVVMGSMNDYLFFTLKKKSWYFFGYFKVVTGCYVVTSFILLSGEMSSSGFQSFFDFTFSS